MELDPFEIPPKEKTKIAKNCKDALIPKYNSHNLMFNKPISEFNDVKVIESWKILFEN